MGTNEQKRATGHSVILDRRIVDIIGIYDELVLSFVTPAS
jgi:hypothetical protein